MKDEEINTYQRGLEFKSSKNITKKEFISLCDDLTNEFNKLYNSNEYKLKPEQNSKGGIVFEHCDNKDTYKSMRFYFNDAKTGIGLLYGFIPDNVCELWKNDTPLLLPKNRFRNLSKKFQWCSILDFYWI